MVLFSVEAKTPVSIFMDEGSEIKADFIENYDNKIFYVQSPVISDNMEAFINREVNVEIFFKEGFYKAECRILGPGIKKRRYETVALEARDEFKFEAQRSSFRVFIDIPAEIYLYAENKNNFFRGGLICKSVSKDLSGDGIYLVTKQKIDEPKETMFTISFYLSNYTFFIPAKLMWNRRSDTFNYDYGFLFDFSVMPELQDKLITAILKEKLK